MTRRIPRLVVASAVAAAIGLVSLAASSAFAGGGKAAPPPAKPGAAPAATPLKAASLAELEQACDKAEEAANKDMRRKRFEAVLAYIAANASAADAEKAAGVAVDLATELEDWTKAIAQADAYVKAHAEGARKAEVLLQKATALTHTGAKLDDIKKAYETGFSAVNIEKANAQQVFNGYMAYAEYLADESDLEGAKAVYDKMQEAFTGHPANRSVAQAALSATRALESIGSDPLEIPAGTKDLDGKEVKLADWKGKVLLVDFWGTWCGPCRAEMPHVIAAYNRFREKGFDVLGVSIPPFNEPTTAEGLQEVKEFIKERAMPWRQVYEGSPECFAASGSNGVPYTILIGKDGKVVRTGLRGEALLRKLEKLLGK